MIGGIRPGNSGPLDFIVLLEKRLDFNEVSDSERGEGSGGFTMMDYFIP